MNIEAIRSLRGVVPCADNDSPQGTSTKIPDGSKALQHYILGLALVAATDEPDLNLREGCHLRYADEPPASIKLVYRSKPEQPCTFTNMEVLEFANSAKLEFFKLANRGEEAIDRCDVVFETGVAEKFLAYSQKERDKIRKLGPLTRETLARFEAQSSDPFKAVTDELKNVKKALGAKPRRKGAQPTRKIEVFTPVGELLRQVAEQEVLSTEAMELAGDLLGLTQEHDDSHEALRDMESKIREYKQALKQGTLETLKSEARE